MERADSACTTLSSHSSILEETIQWKKGNVLGKGAFGTVSNQGYTSLVLFWVVKQRLGKKNISVKVSQSLFSLIFIGL